MAEKVVCLCCRKLVTTIKEDFGIGPGEAYGRKFVDKNIVEVCSHCESPNFEALPDLKENMKQWLSDSIYELFSIYEDVDISKKELNKIHNAIVTVMFPAVPSMKEDEDATSEQSNQTKAK